jgi:hypothetical protein
MVEPWIYYVGVDGVSYAAINCPAGCEHRTAPGAYCGGCQVDPSRYRCPTCRDRGAIPTVTTTIAPGLVNDDPPTGTITVTINPGGNCPPGHMA